MSNCMFLVIVKKQAREKQLCLRDGRRVIVGVNANRVREVKVRRRILEKKLNSKAARRIARMYGGFG